jgi:hypothetical protein
LLIFSLGSQGCHQDPWAKRTIKSAFGMKGEKPMVGVAPHAVKVIAQGGFFFFEGRYKSSSGIP